MKREIVLTATVEEIAQAFCELDNNEQAEFFGLIWRKMHEVVDQEKANNPRNLNLGADWQFWQIGKSAKDAGIYSDAAEAIGAIAAPLFTHTLGLS